MNLLVGLLRERVASPQVDSTVAAAAAKDLFFYTGLVKGDRGKLLDWLERPEEWLQAQQD